MSLWSLLQLSSDQNRPENITEIGLIFHRAFKDGKVNNELF